MMTERRMQLPDDSCCDMQQNKKEYRVQINLGAKTVKIVPAGSIIELDKLYKSLKESQEIASKCLKKMNKTVQDLKLEIKSIKKTQTKEIL